jgi:hypothetical protein
MRLIDLEPCFRKHSIEPADECHGRTETLPSMQLLIDRTQLPLMEFKYIRWGGFPTTVFRVVSDISQADRVSFLCPKCFTDNGGKIGTHRIAIDFIGRGTPDEACVHNDQGQPVRWSFSGTCLEDLALTPSIQIIGGCNWHGYVDADGIRTC